jgi:multiple antibiotic resistance protein
MTIYSATILLWLVMDPLGNIPGFLAVLNSVDPRRHMIIILRESLFAFLILTFFLFAGESFLQSLQLSQAALDIAGGIILFLIAIRMIFPEHSENGRERFGGEPFIVPLAIPFIAGPSALATVMVFSSQAPDHLWYWFGALTIASVLSTITLLFSNALKKILGQKGLIALERLMGMILTTIAVQMLLTGIDLYFHLNKG